MKFGDSFPETGNAHFEIIIYNNVNSAKVSNQCYYHVETDTFICF